MNRDWSICLIGAVACHLGLLLGLQAALNQPARLPPNPAVEVMLIAAPAATPVAVVSPPVEAPKPVVIPPPPQPVVAKALEPLPEAKPLIPVAVPAEPVVAPTPPASAIPSVQPATAPSAVVGDGSSAKAGLDATTAHVQPGARAQPNYAKNPEPLYPLAARRRRQQGLVLLSVKVTSLGHAAHVALKQSSGFTLLDEAALQAVRDWEFEPAHIGPLAVESEIEVPVRFQLGD